MKIKNLQILRGMIDPHLYEALASIQQQATASEEQANTNPLGQPPPPPTIQSVNVAASDGHMHVSLIDQSVGLKRGVHYFVETDTQAHFPSPIITDIGTSRNYQKFVGNARLYVRAYSAYPSGLSSPPVYHGTQVTPRLVQGGGTIPAGPNVPSQGAGTGAPAVGLHGPGPVPVRISTSTDES